MGAAALCHVTLFVLKSTQCFGHSKKPEGLRMIINKSRVTSWRWSVLSKALKTRSKSLRSKHDTAAGFSFSFFQTHHKPKLRLSKQSLKAGVINPWQQSSDLSLRVLQKAWCSAGQVNRNNSMVSSGCRARLQRLLETVLYLVFEEFHPE